MIPGMNPKKMQAMMKQLGIAQEQIDANRVIIECDDKKIIISDPEVLQIKMQGQQNFQISGDISEVSLEQSEDEEDDLEEDHLEEDIKTIIEKTGCSEDEAKEALEESKGDLTEAILALS